MAPEWPHGAAVVAHDGEMASVGITTVFDAVRAGGLKDRSKASRSFGYARPVATEIRRLAAAALTFDGFGTRFRGNSGSIVHGVPPWPSASVAMGVGEEAAAARCIARRMALYAPHRHTLPDMNRSMSSSVGCGMSARRAVADMI